MNGLYQGFANRETWAVPMWFNNCRYAYKAMRLKASEAPFTAETAKQWVMHVMPHGVPDFPRGKAATAKAYAAVKWQDVAEDFNAGAE